MKLLVDEDLLSMSLLRCLREAGHEVVQLPTGTSDETVFAEAQRQSIPILTANVGRKGRHDPRGLYRLALNHAPHYGVIGIFRIDPRRRLSNETIVEALNRLEDRERNQPGTAISTIDITRLNDFLTS